MADDVAIQGEGLETLHLKVLRRKWQILALQITATISLFAMYIVCLLYTSPSPRDRTRARKPSSA